MNIPELIRKEGLRRGYSPRTIKTYQDCLINFFNQCHKDPKKVTKKDVTNYLDGLIEKKRSSSTLNVNLSSLKFLFTEILGKKLLVNIKYSKRPKRIPEILEREELLALFRSINNKKHKVMIILMYSAGLRISELLDLKVKDLNLNHNYGWVRQGKGRKDRRFIIAKGLNEHLRLWIKDKPYDSLLFEGRSGKMNPNTIRRILKKAAKISGIKKRVHPHMLRHCFGTDYVRDNHSALDLSALQMLLGHKDIKTTMGYVHLAGTNFKSKSPYDNFTAKPL